MRALAIAATGMNAQQTNLEVIANNIANVNTTGYKRARAEFSDLIYQTERTEGVPNSANSTVVPEGAHVGLGVQLVAVRNLHLQGQLAQTGNDLDLALVGRGWFQVKDAQGNILYSRAGAFNTDQNGQLVTADGYAVDPSITIPQNTTKITVSRSGQVFAQVGNSSTLTNVGQLTIANFANEAGLEPLGDNLFRETDASGSPVVANPGDPGFAHIQQGYLEQSNVDPVKEITDMISAQHAYEMDSKIIQAADEMASVVSKNLG